MSTVCKGNERKRPSWNYQNVSSNEPLLMTLEMTESVRNAVEELQKSQVLHCDVARAIKDIAKTLRRIDRRMKENGLRAR